MPLALSTLLQISDSAFPTGAFAYSSGLEALARAGQFPAMRALEVYLDAHLRQAAAFDLAFVAAAHDAYGISGASKIDEPDLYGVGAAASGWLHAPAMPEQDTRRPNLWDLCAEWDATLWNTGMRTASLRQARALVDSVIDTFAEAGSEDTADITTALRPLREDAARPDAALHFAPALGYALAALGASRAQACTLYLHGIARDQAAAAVRLGLVGPRAAQALQARALARAAENLGECLNLPAPRHARRTAPIVETGQGGHGFLYSRLFQN